MIYKQIYLIGKKNYKLSNIKKIFIFFIIFPQKYTKSKF
jgi:hypothetical protein